MRRSPSVGAALFLLKQRADPLSGHEPFPVSRELLIIELIVGFLPSRKCPSQLGLNNALEVLNTTLSNLISDRKMFHLLLLAGYSTEVNTSVPRTTLQFCVFISFNST
jgi:hypothetical protein